MVVPISDRLFVAYQCKYKAYLKLAGKCGTKGEYEIFWMTSPHHIGDVHGSTSNKAIKLFTFLDYDGIPWNNNNAEHAINRFAQLRKAIGGSSTAKGIQEYLVLLSICETLRLRNASFLRFLMSGATDIDEYLKPQSKKAS